MATKDVNSNAELQMLEDNSNSNLATAGNSDGETALHVLAHDPSTFVSENRPYEAVSIERGKLYRAALNGDWKSIKDIQKIQRKITKKGETTLHIAAAANQEEFVDDLLEWMEKNNLITSENVAENVTLTAENTVGNTALTYAAATGNVNVAIAMMEKNDQLPNLGNGIKPLYMAASLGHGQMTNYLYSQTKERVREWDFQEQVKLFIACVKGGIYGVALQMLEDNSNSNLAAARNSDGETALRVLARDPSAFVSENRPWLKFKQENSKQSAANDLFTKCLEDYKWDVETDTQEIPRALFEAARVGNVEFMVKLIRFDFDLLWKTENHKSIFHIAVEERHESIFNLLRELDSFGNIIVQEITENGSNILHLAAGLARREKLNAIPGAALQMQRELLWFKEVEKFVSADFIEMKNEKGRTPYVLFAKEHEELRRDGEKWMRDTANYSMVVAVLIGSIMFAGQVADGLDKKPHLFLAFSVSSVISLFGSTTSLIMFLSILTSSYSFEDFLVSLPVRLMIGVTSLHISIVAMMVSFATSFSLKNYNQRDVIFVVIGLCACVPIMDVWLKHRLVFDIFQSTFFRFRPQHRLLQDEISNAPVRGSQPHAPEDPASVRIEQPPQN